MVALWQNVVERLSRLQWLPNLILRVTVGFMFASGAIDKFRDIEGFTAMFEDLGIRLAGVQAPMVAAIELAGGLGLMVGLGTRVVSALLAGTMVVAMLTAVGPPLLEEYPSLWYFLSNLFYLSEWLLLGILTWLVCAGADRASLDAMFCRRA